MKNCIIIYTSKRGSTERYAGWISEDLKCESVSLEKALSRKLNLREYGCVIYGGWIRGSGIVGFDKFGKILDEDLLKRLIVFGVGVADETAENYAQVWEYSIGRIDPKNSGGAVLYIFGGRYDPQAVKGMDRIMMKMMRTVLLSGSIDEAKSEAYKIKDRIDNGADMVKRENIYSLVKDAERRISAAIPEA